MSTPIAIGNAPLTLEQVCSVARESTAVVWAPGTLELIAKGRAALESRLASGERIYGVNTGVGGNIKFELSAGTI